MPKVSIIMPSLNVAQYINECIESVIAQTLSDIEILCIDAGSTDGTREILDEYASNDARIRVVHSDIRSYGYQINLGISLSTGEYIAIVETDDYIHEQMYNYLYNISQETKADIIKADFDSFTTYDNGRKVFNKFKLFKGNEENYNKLINPKEVEQLYASDIGIWKGLYNRAFLIDNNIKLHESKGAAYQDIGFMHQVLSLAKSAYYSDRSFYRYRMDREESSIHSPKSLGFARQDFEWLIEEKDVLSITPSKRGFFKHMISSIVGEMKNVLPVVKYDVESEFIKPHYLWFVDVLKEEASEYFEYFGDFFEDFSLIINDLERFASKVKEEKAKQKAKVDNIKEKVLDIKSDSEVKTIIFGTGAWGTKVLEILYGNNVKDILYSDNNSKLWGTTVNEIEVIEPKDIISIDDDYIVVIANKYHSKEIETQLLKLGVSSEDMVIY